MNRHPREDSRNRNDEPAPVRRPLARPVGLLVAAVALALALAAPAAAHQGNPDFRSIVNAIEPAGLATGLEAEVVNFDDHVVLVNDSGKDVLILGYDGEPYARISADGKVEVNLNSPTHYLNEDRFADVAIPERADKDAKPSWELVDTTGRFEWHDHRSHYMSESDPPQVKDKSQRTKVFDYAIPIEVGGKPARIDGTLFWQGRDTGAPVVPFVLLGLLVVGGVAFVLIRRARRGESDPGEERENEAW